MKFQWNRASSWKNKTLQENDAHELTRQSLLDISSMSIIEKQVLEHSVLLIQRQFRFYKAVQQWRWITNRVLAQSFAGLKVHHQSELNAMKVASQTINRLYNSKATLEAEYENYVKKMDQTELTLLNREKKFQLEQIVAYNDEVSRKQELLRKQYAKKLRDQTLVSRLEQGENFADIFSQYQQILQNDLRAKTASYENKRRQIVNVDSITQRPHTVDDYRTVYALSQNFYPRTQFNIGPNTVECNKLPMLNARYSSAANNVMQINYRTFDRWENVDTSLVKKDLYVLRDYCNKHSALQRELEQNIEKVEIQHKISTTGISTRLEAKKRIVAQDYQSKFVQLKDDVKKWKKIILNLRAANVYFGRQILECKLEGKNYFPAMSMNKEIKARKKILETMRNTLVEDEKEYWISSMILVREKWRYSRNRRQRHNISTRSDRVSSSIDEDFDILKRFAKSTNMTHNEMMVNYQAKKMLNDMKNSEGLHDIQNIRNYIIYKKISDGKLQLNPEQWNALQSLAFQERDRVPTQSSVHESIVESENSSLESSTSTEQSFGAKFASTFDVRNRDTENTSELINSPRNQIQWKTDTNSKHDKKFGSWSIATQNGSINDKLLRDKQKKIGTMPINKRTLTYRQKLHQHRPSTTPLLDNSFGTSSNNRFKAWSKLKNATHVNSRLKKRRRQNFKTSHDQENQAERYRSESRVPVWSIFRKVGLGKSAILK